MVARLNLNGRCYINSATFCCISQLFLVKCMNFCSERKITPKGFVTLTCDNQFFINFELNWWQEVSDGPFWTSDPCPPPQIKILIRNPWYEWFMRSKRINTTNPIRVYQKIRTLSAAFPERTGVHVWDSLLQPIGNHVHAPQFFPGNGSFFLLTCFDGFEMKFYWNKASCLAIFHSYLV